MRGPRGSPQLDQDIAADGFFSLGMLADFEASLQTFGPSFYRHLFWETGIVGQALYLEAEAAGARATGIGASTTIPSTTCWGCGPAFQSLYHFTVGMPVDDARLTTDPGTLGRRQDSLLEPARKRPSSSSGSGKMIVEFFSAAISVSVCR